jgi:MFS family permease
MQGFSASGEQSGGNSLTLEHAPDERRAFFSSFTQAGLVIATAIGCRSAGCRSMTC